MSHPQPDREAILQALSMLFPPEDIVELRAFYKGKNASMPGISISNTGNNWLSKQYGSMRRAAPPT